MHKENEQVKQFCLVVEKFLIPLPCHLCFALVQSERAAEMCWGGGLQGKTQLHIVNMNILVVREFSPQSYAVSKEKYTNPLQSFTQNSVQVLWLLHPPKRLAMMPSCNSPSSMYWHNKLFPFKVIWMAGRLIKTWNGESVESTQPALGQRVQQWTQNRSESWFCLIWCAALLQTK